MKQQPNYDYDSLNQVYGNQTQPSGIFGSVMSSPITQGILATGLGALASRGTTAQAIGRGGLMGLSAYGQAQDQQNNQLLQMAQAKVRQNALNQLTPDQNGKINAPMSTWISAGANFKDIPSLINANRDKLKETQTMTNADGSQSVYGISDYGAVNDTGLKNAPKINAQDIGGQITGINPYTGQQAWNVGKTMSPGESETSRHNRVTESQGAQRLAFDQSQPKGQVVTTDNGGLMIVDPRGATARPVLGQDGQPIKGKTPGQNGKLPTAALKLQQEDMDAIGSSSALAADLGAVINQIDNKQLNLGFTSNNWNRAKNYLGMSDQESRNLASLDANLERMRNESLRLNKGVQTEGDSQRAWNELLANINDPKVVKQRLNEIIQINKRATLLRQNNMDVIRSNYGLDPLDTSNIQSVPAAVGNQGQPQSGTNVNSLLDKYK